MPRVAEGQVNLQLKNRGIGLFPSFFQPNMDQAWFKFKIVEVGMHNNTQPLIYEIS
jgi:hypothetical protein